MFFSSLYQDPWVYMLCTQYPRVQPMTRPSTATQHYEEKHPLRTMVMERVLQETVWMGVAEMLMAVKSLLGVAMVLWW